jgi:manganese/zinc/iron transport system permease protein
LVLLANIAFALKFGAEWRAMTFDPVQPAMDPRRRQVIERVSLFVVASSVVAAFSAVGAVMAVALMVVPAAVMSLASRRWAVVLVGAPLLGAATAGVGTWVSWNPDWSPSGTIILVLAVVFFGALLFTPESGIWAAARRRLRQKGLVQGSALVVHLATHANTEREAYESQWGHLITELGWKPAEARRAVRAAVGQGWIMDGPQLRLTPDGQALAESLTMPARRTIAS